MVAKVSRVTLENKLVVLRRNVRRIDNNRRQPRVLGSRGAVERERERGWITSRVVGGRSSGRNYFPENLPIAGLPRNVYIYGRDRDVSRAEIPLCRLCVSRVRRTYFGTRSRTNRFCEDGVIAIYANPRFPRQTARSKRNAIYWALARSARGKIFSQRWHGQPCSN